MKTKIRYLSEQELIELHRCLLYILIDFISICDKYNLKYEIEVDGGINANTSKLCRESGSDILVAGSYIFSSTDYKQKIKELNNENL